MIKAKAAAAGKDCIVYEAEVLQCLRRTAPIRIRLSKTQLIVPWKDPSDDTRVIDEVMTETLLGLGFEVWCFVTRLGDWFLHTTEKGFQTILTIERCRTQDASLTAVRDSERVYVGHTSREVGWMLGLTVGEFTEQVRLGRLPVGTSAVRILDDEG